MLHYTSIEGHEGSAVGSAGLNYSRSSTTTDTTTAANAAQSTHVDVLSLNRSLFRTDCETVAPMSTTMPGTITQPNPVQNTAITPSSIREEGAADGEATGFEPRGGLRARGSTPPPSA